MKICRRCNESKPYDQFNRLASSSDGFAYHCKKCHHLFVADSRRKRGTAYRRADKARTKRKKLVFLEWKETLKCQLCPETFVYCIEFHHLDPTQKDFDISSNVHKYTLARLRIELGKCASVCANCHRKIHYNQVDAPKEPCDLTKFPTPP